MKRILLLLLGLVQFACAAAPATQPHRAIRYEHEVRQEPPQHLHIAIADLGDPDLDATVRPAGTIEDDKWQTSLMTVRAISERDHLLVAVNGDFFSVRGTRQIAGRNVPYFDGNPARVTGWAMTDGRLWSRPADGKGAALIVTADRRIVITDNVGGHLENAKQIIGGSVLIVSEGKALPQPQARRGDRNFLAPRTAAGTDREGRKLILLAVDGRRKDYSAGLSLEELGREMVKLGCHTALNLDGGGSTTMVVRGLGEHTVVNRPSDGSDFAVPLSRERPVANVLGIRSREQARDK